MIPYSFYPIVPPSTKEIQLLIDLQKSSQDHHSGGSFNMLSLGVKGKNRIQGKNRLDRPANTMNNSYPEFAGFHAELDLWRVASDLKNSTVYIAGTIEKSGNPMQNTCPCVYCSAILIESQVKRIVYYNEGYIVATNVKEIVIP